MILAAAFALIVGGAATVSGCTKEPERSVAEYCTRARPVIGFDVVLASGDTAKVNRTVQDLRKLQEVAPSEIVGPVGVLVTITDELSQAMADGKDPDLAAKEVFKDRQQDVAKIDDAGKAVQSYTSDHCHFSVVGTIAPGTVPGTRPGTGPGSAPGSTSKTTSTAKPTTSAVRSTTTTSKSTTATTTTTTTTTKKN